MWADSGALDDDERARPLHEQRFRAIEEDEEATEDDDVTQVGS